MSQELTTGSLFESEIKTFGQKIFSAIGSEHPSAFNPNFWASRIMLWSMTDPQFKVNMFRLVDVLPSLRSSKLCSNHIKEYLNGSAKAFNPLLGLALKLSGLPFLAPLQGWLTKRAIAKLASIFIAGETPRHALPVLRRLRRQRLCYTVDLLGELAVSEKETRSYLERYLEALDVFGQAFSSSKPIIAGHPAEQMPVCISVKLSALYSQSSVLNYKQSVEILSQRLKLIVNRAAKLKASLYIDAEDSAINPVIYETFKQVFLSPEYKSFAYPGIVVQAYLKNSADIVADLLDYAAKRKHPIAVRLVKGAYWDQEQILAKQNGWDPPVFMRKAETDANYETLSQVLLDNHALTLPAFGSHNIRSLSHACIYARNRGLHNTAFELQMLYGMAEPIARAFSKEGYLTRLYVPLGNMLVGMGYLVRRLLENTSNESFLKHAFFEASAVKQLLEKPE
jgi:RHH-type proline utilization regulon transcriptional repressor/proline dehydrogenase/delta 1-pyrroline-5-carboxylate dehydrogenase